MFDEDFPEPHLDPDELNDIGYDEEEMKELLNKLERGVVGAVKPRVDHVVIPMDWPSWYDSDNDARSPLEADLE